METTAVEFINRVGYRLSGLLDTPAVGAIRAYALFAHCFTCGKDLKPFANLNAALTDRGIGVLRFDFSGLGRSEGEFSDSNLSSNETDLIDAARFLGNNYGPAKILIGHSLGGIAVLRAAKQIAESKAVVTIGSPSDPSHLGEKLSRAKEQAKSNGQSDVSIGGRTFTLRREFFEVLEASSVQEDLRELGRALLVLHSPNDESVDIENAARIFQAARHPKSFVSLDHADHLLLDEKSARYAGSVIAAWVDGYL